MKVLNRALIVVCIWMCSLGPAGLVFGAEWKFYYQTEAERENRTVTEKLYFDASSMVKPEKNIVRVTQKITLLGADEKETDSRLRLIEMNCSSRNYRVLSVTKFEEETGKAGTEIRDDNAPWIRFYLDSVIGGLYYSICFEKKQPKQAEKKPEKQSVKEGEKPKDK